MPHAIKAGKMPGANNTHGQIHALQAFGAADVDVDAAAVGEALFNSLNMMFIECVKSDTPPGDLKVAVAWQNDPVVQPISAGRFKIA
jgi:hypothetical protein